LARSAEKAAPLKAEGMTVVLGELKRPDSYLPAAERCDVLVHAGFEYGPRAAQTDRTALEALAGCARSGRGPRALVYTSGVWVLGPRGDAAADEEAPLRPPEAVAWRPAHEALALDAARGGVSAAVVRPGCVYGGREGLYALMFRSLFETRAIRLAGDGRNAWASVYLDDLAELYRLVVEKRPEREVYHATDGSADPIGAVAEAFVEAAGGGAVETRPLSEARRELGPMADALAMDQRVSSAKARRELGWSPRLDSAARNAALLLTGWHDRPIGMAVS